MKKIAKLILALFGFSMVFLAFQNFGSIDPAQLEEKSSSIEAKKKSRNPFSGRSQK